MGRNALQGQLAMSRPPATLARLLFFGGSSRRFLRTWVFRCSRRFPFAIGRSPGCRLHHRARADSAPTGVALVAPGSGDALGLPSRGPVPTTVKESNILPRLWVFKCVFDHVREGPL